MKTRFLIMIGVASAIAIVTALSLSYNQEIKLATGMMISDEKSQPQKILPDPICFVIDRSSSGKTGGSVTMDKCVKLTEFEDMGCTLPMLGHLYRYSNLLDYESDGNWYMKFIDLPSGMSVAEFDICVDAIVKMRPILNSTSPEPIHNDTPVKRIKIEGEMAEQICEIMGGGCPSYYIGNVQDDGSIMIGITISQPSGEVFHMFFINNGVLTHEIRENGN